MQRLVIKNGMVVTPSGIIMGGLAASDGRIVHIGADQSLPRGSLEVDARGCYVIPGIIDPHV